MKNYLERGLKLFDKDKRLIEITNIINKDSEIYYIFRDIKDNDFIRYGAIGQYFEDIIELSS